jgi:hypothetical protein
MLRRLRQARGAGVTDHVIPIDERLLPPLLRQIVRAIGAPAALKLLKQRGGTRVYASDGPTLRQILGEEDARRFIAAMAPRTEVLLPKADKILAQLRNRVIRAEAATKSLPEQALEHDLTVRQVINIRAGIEASNRPDPTHDLFEPAQHARKRL